MRKCEYLHAWLAILGFCIGCHFTVGTHCSAETVGLYRFDTVGGNNVGPGGLKWFDSSGAQRDFVSQTDFGTVVLTQDIPSIMPTPTLALDSAAGGARMFSTPSTTAFHRGATGELTVEFWLKSLSTDSTAYYLSFNGGNGGGNLGDWGVYRNTIGDVRFFEYSNISAYPEVGVGAAATNGAWNHLAFSVDNAGVLRSYFNGALVNQTTATGTAAPALADTLKFGRAQSDSLASHHFLMDDLRISNVALLPGQGTGVNELAWNAPLSLAPDLEPREIDFGRQWVRDNDYVITSWGHSNTPQLFNEANFNSALGGEYDVLLANGVKPMYLGGSTHLDNQLRTRIQQALSVGVKSFLIRDELPPSEIASAKQVADYIRSVSDDALIIVGLGSSTPANVDQVIQGVKPDAVIHGFYPFSGATSATDQWYGGGLTDVALIRERAIHYDLPYFAFVQSFDDSTASSNPPAFRRRLPSESELRAELFTKLSAGVKGMAYFVFQNGINEDFGLVDPTGVKSPLYEPAKAANKELATLGESLRFLESQDWRFVSGGAAATPEYMEAFDAAAGFGKLESVVVNSAAADRKDAVVGTFHDDNGGEYFMLVNTFHGSALSAASAAISFTLTFDDAVDSIWRLDRLTGQVEKLDLTGDSLNITLPGGTGDLFKLGDGAFAGLELAGDFNGDLRVDAADYTVWRDRSGSLAEYQEWKSNFGASRYLADQGMGSAFAVPEPGSLIAFLVGLACIFGSVSRPFLRR